ncbi:hypothetical protein E2542_SST23869 [Spatholobus suberectus]|nr:hypothetical protein E2542_SST23869 [Spatholobus suberectus]
MNLPPIKATPLKGECSNCRLKERLLLHRLSIRGMDRRVCTSCVLRLHPSFFCPSCFEFFEHPIPSASAHRFVSCTKCSSLTHLDCLPSPPPATFLCPPCSQPNFSFFPDSNSPLDKRRALVLLCACKVAAAALAKSLALARARVDQTVRDAAAARKKAREALDLCSVLDKVKRLETSLEVSNSRNLGTNHNNVVCEKEELNGFIVGQGQGKVRVPSEVLPLPRPVNNNDAKLGNRERSCPGRIVDVASTSIL